MESNERLSHLDDRQVLLVLNHLSDELGAETPVQTEHEAREAVAAFVSEFGNESVDAGQETPLDKETAIVARAILARLMDDPEVGETARALVADPPADEQMAVELAIAGAIVLGAVIGWLQTKVDLEVQREGGETSFKFHVQKDATSPGVIRDVAATVRRLLFA